jgi:hypothetical protein
LCRFKKSKAAQIKELAAKKVAITPARLANAGLKIKPFKMLPRRGNKIKAIKM